MILLIRALLSLAVLGWLTGLARLHRRQRRGDWTLGPEDTAVASGRVSVVIPARNERANLPDCLSAVLASDHSPLEVVVIDDGSTDGTGAWLDEQAEADPRLVVLHGEEDLPPGWFGKPWALQRAQEKATGEWLVFVDADVRIHKSAVSRIVGYAQQEGVGVVSGIGRLTLVSFWEKVLQPAVAGLILAGNDMDAVNDPDKAPVMANGQLICASREAYDALGQHEAVRGEVIEDVEIARAALRADVGYRFLLMRQLFSCRMYTSFSEIWAGWSKNLFAGIHRSWPLLLLIEIWLFVQVLAGPILLGAGLAGVLGREWLIWGALLCALMQWLRFRMDRAWELDWRYGLTHAPATGLVMALLLNSGLQSGKGVAWKGRMVR